jgi:hypothetical protein
MTQGTLVGTFCGPGNMNNFYLIKNSAGRYKWLNLYTKKKYDGSVQ